jgi:hypothetical protein
MRKLIIALCLIPLLGISQTKNSVTNRYVNENGKILEFENALASHAPKYHTNGFVAGAVSEKLLYSFLNSFPLAENVKWCEDDKGYFASFTQSGILSKVAYDPQGGFLYAMRYYNEEKLPVSVLLALRKKFPGKKIFGITESSTRDNITYHVKLEDETSWYGVQVTSSGDVTLEEQFQKSN